MASFYEIFKTACQRKGISCRQAIREIGLSESITSAWKRTGAMPHGSTLNKIASYFNVTIPELLGTESPQSHCLYFISFQAVQPDGSAIIKNDLVEMDSPIPSINMVRNLEEKIKRDNGYLSVTAIDISKV